LRRLAGDEAFEKAMDSFGRKHAGKPVTAAEFQAHFEEAIGAPLKGCFPWWLNEPGLPELKLVEASTKKMALIPAGNQHLPDVWVVKVKVSGPVNLPRLAVEVTIETETGEQTKTVVLENGAGTCSIQLNKKDKPRRAVVEKYGCLPSNGGAFAVRSFEHDIEETLIV
jgi:aminopeptidase N